MKKGVGKQISNAFSLVHSCPRCGIAPSNRQQNNGYGVSVISGVSAVAVTLLSVAIGATTPVSVETSGVSAAGWHPNVTAATSADEANKSDFFIGDPLESDSRTVT